MKKYLSMLAVVCVGVLCGGYFAYGAYGGGGSSSSSVMLTRDVCPDGDFSRSYYDGTCGEAVETSTTPAESSFTTQSVAPSDELHRVAQDEELIQTILEKKKELEEKIRPPYLPIVTLPAKYLRAQLKIEKLFAKWDVFTQEEKNKKIVVLLKKIDTLKTKHILSEKLQTIIQYVEDRAVLMSNFSS